MKISSHHNDVERIGIDHESTYTINATADSFEILSSGIYSDPISAIIREISCNAVDAHTSAGISDVPFEVGLPTSMNPVFRVRDFGKGLSHEDVTRIYTTYFESTKKTSNETIGALGLGSKSPFSYAPAYEVISWHEGTKSTYSMFLNERGFPCVALMASTPSDEPSGLEVRLAVRSSDFYQFQKKTQTQLRYFKTKPKIIHSSDFVYDPAPVPTDKNRNWVAAINRANTLTVIMGGVAYKTKVSRLNEELSAQSRNLLRIVGLFLFLDIGDVNVAPSREDIRYDSATIKFIDKTLKAIVDDIYALAIDAISPTSSDWDNFRSIDAVSQKLLNNVNNLSDVLRHHKIKNATLSKYVRDSGNFNISAIGRKYYNVSHYHNRSAKGYWHRQILAKRDSAHIQVRPSQDKCNVVLCDVSTHVKPRLAEAFPTGDVLCITPNFTQSNIPPGAKAELASIQKILGDVKPALLRDISSPPPPVVRNRAWYTINRSFRYWIPREKPWIRNSLSEVDSVIYVQLSADKKTILHDNLSTQHITPRDVKDVVTTMVNLVNLHEGSNYVPSDVVGVCSKANISFLQKHHNGRNLIDIMEELIPIYNSRMEKYTQYVVTDDFFDIKDIARRVAKGKCNDELVKSINNCPVLSDMLTSLVDVDDAINDDAAVALTTICPKKDVAPLYDIGVLYNQFPMLKLIDPKISQPPWSEISEYIQLVTSHNKEA